MQKNRLEAFSDGVIAIIITIMVLEMKVPHEASISAILHLWPVFISYVLSFIYVGIYWSNHHHLLHAVDTITGGALWANLHLLFWLSLFPFVTGWMGENHYEPVTVFLYGIVFLMAGIAYYILGRILICGPEKNRRLSAAIGSDLAGKLSIALYLIALLLTFFNQWLSIALYAGVALIWLIPDRRIEKKTSD